MNTVDLGAKTRTDNKLNPSWVLELNPGCITGMGGECSYHYSETCKRFQIPIQSEESP